MTLAHAILAAHPVGRASGAGAACGPAASCVRQQPSVRSAHSADDTVHQPSNRLVCSARAGNRGTAQIRASHRPTDQTSKE